MMQGRLGCVSPAPTPTCWSSTAIRSRTSALLAADGQHLRLIVRGGEIVKNQLS